MKKKEVKWAAIRLPELPHLLRQCRSKGKKKVQRINCDQHNESVQIVSVQVRLYGSLVHVYWLSDDGKFSLIGIEIWF